MSDVSNRNAISKRSKIRKREHAYVLFCCTDHLWPTNQPNRFSCTVLMWLITIHTDTDPVFLYLYDCSLQLSNYIRIQINCSSWTIATEYSYFNKYCLGLIYGLIGSTIWWRQRSLETVDSCFIHKCFIFRLLRSLKFFIWFDTGNLFKLFGPYGKLS